MLVDDLKDAAQIALPANECRTTTAAFRQLITTGDFRVEFVGAACRGPATKTLRTTGTSVRETRSGRLAPKLSSKSHDSRQG